MSPKFKLYEVEGQDNWTVQIEDGELEGLLFTFGKLDIQEDEKGATVKFEYDIVEDNGHTLTKEQADRIIGSVLDKLLTDAMEYTIERNSRNNDTQELSD